MFHSSDGIIKIHKNSIELGIELQNAFLFFSFLGNQTINTKSLTVFYISKSKKDSYNKISSYQKEMNY